MLNGQGLGPGDEGRIRQEPQKGGRLLAHTVGAVVQAGFEKVLIGRFQARPQGCQDPPAMASGHLQPGVIGQEAARRRRVR